MPVPNDYVHDAVMYIKKAIAAYENPVRNPEHGYPFVLRAVNSLELFETYDVIDMWYYEKEALRRCRNAEFIKIMKVIVDLLHHKIGYGEPSTDPNQLNINFDGE